LNASLAFAFRAEAAALFSSDTSVIGGLVNAYSTVYGIDLWFTGTARGGRV
jgi:hypothetical protein